MAKKQQNNTYTYTITLTEDEAYTVQILLGLVSGDEEVHNVLSKLEAATEDEARLEDYERLEFYYDPSGNNLPKLLNTYDYDMTIKIK